ncbi:MAG: amidohydrolase [Desulfobacteraceae bacterium]|nr:MAG: amidohydrolase [Desulfobacteraceae bacterium]
MPVVKRIADYAEDMKRWRQQLHKHPELLFDCHQTSTFVIDKLKEFGVDEIHEKIAKTGVVAVINGQGEGSGTTLGLRADMDALPMQETTGLEHASIYEGKMHACGHDGHTTMLLGAARYLAETRNFSGQVVLIFQPAEEGGGGAEVMVKEGIMDRFGITEVYAMHISTEACAGHFYTMPGAIMAAVDSFEINIKGLGGHGASPQNTVDPLVAGVGIATAIQTIISRNHDPRQDAVCSVTQFHAGTTHNVIAETAFIGGTIRTFDKGDRQMILRRLREVAEGQASAYNCEVEVKIEEGYPATVNDPKKTEFAVEAAKEVVGESAVNGNTGKELGAEDFAFMLEARPGSYVFLGQGEGIGVHNPKFDFNDDISPYGASFFARIVERAQPVDA